MSSHRAPLTPTQAVTLAGAYGDLVFGTCTPVFTADVAAAFLREQNRQHTIARKESEALLVACFGEETVNTLRSFGDFTARIREVPAPKASAGDEMCANMSPSGFLCDAAREHKNCHATHLATGLIHFWPQHVPAAPTVPHHDDIEWPSLDVVPADVRTVCDKAGDQWRRRKNGGWKFRSPGSKWTKITLPIDNFDNYGPFTCAPVAHAPTEIAPWPTLNAVPTSVRAVKDRLNHRWERRADTTWKGCDEGPRAGCDAGHPGSGPYTPVEDGGA